MKHSIEVAAIIGVFFFVDYSTGNECGRPLGSAKLQGKIVGGYEVGYYKYPWFASLLLDGTPWCAGTLIGPNTIITAAHCFKKYLSQPNANLNEIYKVKLGVNNWCVSEASQKEFNVKKVVVHEKYLSHDPYYDIAIMQLHGSTEGYETACLPPKSVGDNTRGKDALIIGLGTTKFGGSSTYPCNLREARVLIYSDKVCKNMLLKASSYQPDLEIVNAFCAGYLSGGIDACQGDSGGPVLVLGPDGRYAVLGVTSFGYDCALKDRLGVYTDVSHYLDWIREKSGVESQLITTPAPTTPKTNATNSQINPDEKYPISNGQAGVYPPEVSVNGDPLDKLNPSRIIIEYKKHPKRKGHKHHHHSNH